MKYKIISLIYKPIKLLSANLIFIIKIAGIKSSYIR